MRVYERYFAEQRKQAELRKQEGVDAIPFPELLNEYLEFSKNYKSNKMYNEKNYLGRTGTTPAESKRATLTASETARGLNTDCCAKQPGNELNAYNYPIKKGKVLEKFNETFYLKHKDDAALQYTIEALIRDKNPYEIMESLIKIIGDQQEIVKKLLLSQIPQVVILK